MTARDTWRAAIRRDRQKNGPWPRLRACNDNCFGAALAARSTTERAAAAEELASLPSPSVAASLRARPQVLEPPVRRARVLSRFRSSFVVRVRTFCSDLAALVCMLILAAAAVLLPYAYAGGPQ